MKAVDDVEDGLQDISATYWVGPVRPHANPPTWLYR